MEDQVELPVVEGQPFGHVRADDLDIVALALGDPALVLQHPRRIVQHRAPRPQRRKDGHLLSAAAGQPEQPLSPQLAQPFVGHEPHRRELHVPAALQRRRVFRMLDGLSPLPAAVYPAIDGLGVHIRIASLHKKSPFL